MAGIRFSVRFAGATVNTYRFQGRNCEPGNLTACPRQDSRSGTRMSFSAQNKDLFLSFGDLLDFPHQLDERRRCIGFAYCDGVWQTIVWDRFDCVFEPVWLPRGGRMGGKVEESGV